MKGYDPSTGLGYVQEGRYLEVTLPYARTGGQGVLVGTLFGVCTVDGAQGDAINIDTDGVYGLTAATGSGSDAAVGAVAYWDDTNKRVTATQSTHVVIGKFVAAKTTAQAFAMVKIG